MSHFRLIAAIAALTLAGCAHVAVEQSDAPTSHARALVEEVSRLRGLPEKTPVQIHLEGNDEFKKQVQREVDEGLTDDELKREMARWLALGYVAAELDMKTLLERVFSDQVAGFYAPKSKALHVPEGPVPGHEGDLTSDVILVHEVEHSLQDQNFHMPDLHGGDDDLELARSALFEGDATFVMMAWGIVHNPRTPAGTTADAIVPVAKELQNAPSRVLLGMTGKSDALLSAPPILLESLLFPYFSGLNFVAAIFHQGGYQLVNRVFASPPVSTKQVLHPDKYLAGEQPIPIDDFPVPSGDTIVTRGHVGELGIRTMLSDCVGTESAKKTADGWGGDSYLITRNAGGTLALYWTTAWESPADALVFAHAVDSLTKCWKTAAGLAGPHPAITTDVSVLTAGSRVAVVRGLPAAKAETLLGPLLALAHDVPPLAPPISAAELAAAQPPAPTVNHDVGQMAADAWANDWYGLRVPLLTGFSAQTGVPGVLLQMVRRDPDVAGVTVGVVGAPTESATRESTFKAFQDTISAMLGPGTQMKPSGDTYPEIDHVTGILRRWSLSGKFSGVAALALPICDKRAFLLVGQFWHRPEDGTLLDQWAQQLRVHEPAAAPYCTTLPRSPPLTQPTSPH
jgi:hypothetical protein